MNFWWGESTGGAWEMKIALPLNAIWKTLHTGANRPTHLYEYILTPSVMCSQQLSVLN